MRYFVLSTAVLVVACHDAERHVFQAPPPRTPAAVPVAPVATAPIGPIGSRGPESRITGVVDAATGQPVSLTGISGAFQVMAVVARGRNDFPPGAVVHVDMVIRGPTDTTIAAHPGSPAPSIIAHVFDIPVARAGQPGLKRGDYSATVRLVIDDRPLVSSPPIYWTVN